MNEHERKHALELALELKEGPDKSQHSAEYFNSFLKKSMELHELVGPKEVAWLLKQYENEHQVREEGLDDERGKLTKYLIEASSFERNRLYELYCGTYSWEQDSRGGAPTVAYLRGRPVVLDLAWVKIAGELVCFWHPTSELVDYPVISKWLKIAFPDVDQRSDYRFTNATGFPSIISTIKQHIDGKKGIENLRSKS